jgi:hypothetical protein
MKEVSREASTGCPVRFEGLTRDLVLAGGAVRVLDSFGDDGLRDRGVHCSLLSLES